jgi:IS5 family transposase
MKANIGADATSGVLHILVGTAANVADVTQVDNLLHGVKTYVLGYAGYSGAAKRAAHSYKDVIWSFAARSSSYRHRRKGSVLFRVKCKIEYAKAQLRAEVEQSVPSDQSALQPSYGLLPWTREEYGAVPQSVWVGQPDAG